MPDLELGWQHDVATWQQYGLTLTARLVVDENHLAHLRSDVRNGYIEEEDYQTELESLESGEYVAYGVSVTASLLVSVPSGYTHMQTGQWTDVISHQTVELGEDSVWGVVVEGRDDPYIAEVVGQCADMALYQARRVLAALREVEIPEEEKADA